MTFFFSERERLNVTCRGNWSPFANPFRGSHLAMGEEAKEEELVNIPLLKLGVKAEQEQQRKREEMAEKGSNELKARLKSLTLPHSGDRLNMVSDTALPSGYTFNLRSL